MGGGVNLMLVLMRSFLDRGQTRIKFLKVLAAIISMCRPHVMFLSGITRRCFT
jgi:hypothetical protein